MRVKFKLEKRVFAELVNTLAKLPNGSLIDITTFDIINFRELYFDVMKKNENWKLEPSYYTFKQHTLSIDVNHFSVIQQICWQITGCAYERAIVANIARQVYPQISKYLTINKINP